jgi:hypothetical protein
MNRIDAARDRVLQPPKRIFRKSSHDGASMRRYDCRLSIGKSVFHGDLRRSGSRQAKGRNQD